MATRLRLRRQLLGRVFSWWIIRRAAGIWVALRVCAGVFGYLAGSASSAGIVTRLTGGVGASVLVAGCTIGLTLLEAHRRHELLLFRNLGVHPAAIVATTALAPVLGELVVAVWR